MSSSKSIAKYLDLPRCFAIISVYFSWITYSNLFLKFKFSITKLKVEMIELNWLKKKFLFVLIFEYLKSYLWSKGIQWQIKIIIYVN